MFRRILLSAAFVLVSVPLALAQDMTVTGTVTDADSDFPLPGVNIAVKGTMTGTATGIDGTYSIRVNSGDVLVFSFVGYLPQEVTVADQTTINVALQEDVALLSEVVVVGYGTQRRGEITGAVSSVDVGQASVGQVASPQEMLSGRISGVNVAPNSGEPGAGTSIRIRGTSSISAGNEPLYVIDGIPINNTNMTPGGVDQGGVEASNTTDPLAMINPQDIKSIQILKDAAATAIYGSEGANGVVLIETKRGEAGAVQVDYNGRVSAGSFANKLDILSGDEYRQALRDVLGSNPTSTVSTDWQDATTQSTLSHNHNVSISGGTANTLFRASVGYLDQEGLLLNTGIERVTARVNGSTTVLDDKMTVDVNLTGSYLKRNHGFFNQGSGFEAGAIKSMVAFLPTEPVRSADGSFNEFARDIRNPVGLLEQITDITDQERILGNFSIQYDLLDNLIAKGTFGVDMQDGIRRTYIPLVSSIGGEVGGIARQAERSLSNIVTQATVQYNGELGDRQTYSVLGGFEFKREVFQDFGTESRDFISDATLFNNLAGGSNVQIPFSNKAAVNQASFFSRATYNYQDKYLVTATLRRDGSSVFGENDQFALFPSGSVGWRLSNEPFLADVDFIEDLKLRASVGLTGNQAVPPYQALATLAPSEDFRYVFGEEESVIIGAAPERAANPDLKWEQTVEYNVGVDYSFLRGRIDGSLDVYKRNTTDLLLDVRVPPPAPSEFVLQNIGEVENRGIEFAVNAFLFDREDWGLDVNVTASSNYNEVIDLGDRGFISHTAVSGQGQSEVNAQRLEEGHPVGAFFAPIFAGIDGDGNELYRTPDGGTTTVLSEAESGFFGNPIPDLSYSFNLNLRYKAFDLSAFFRGEQGKEILNNTALEFQTLGKLGSNNFLADALTDGTNTAHVPVFSTRWIQDASFFRLDNVTLGYTIPNDVAARAKLRRARISLTAQNLFVLTPYEGYDPEVNTNIDADDTGFRSLARPDSGIDYFPYPKSRTFTFSIELGI